MNVNNSYDLKCNMSYLLNNVQMKAEHETIELMLFKAKVAVILWLIQMVSSK